MAADPVSGAGRAPRWWQVRRRALAWLDRRIDARADARIAASMCSVLKVGVHPNERREQVRDGALAELLHLLRQPTEDEVDRVVR